jgi:hypothetical protein
MPLSDQELKQKLQDLQDRDKEQRRVIETFGVDLGKRRKVDLNFWAPDESRACAFGEAFVRNEGGAPVISGPASETEEDQRWHVRCVLDASVDFMTERENVATFLLFADKYECEYDGWGTAIVEAATRMPEADGNKE